MTIGSTSLTLSKYSPTYDRAIKAAWGTLQSWDCESIYSTIEDNIGKVNFSPTAEISLSIQSIPNLTSESFSSYSF